MLVAVGVLVIVAGPWPVQEVGAQAQDCVDLQLSPCVLWVEEIACEIIYGDTESTCTPSVVPCEQPGVEELSFCGGERGGACTDAPPDAAQCEEDLCHQYLLQEGSCIREQCDNPVLKYLNEEECDPEPISIEPCDEPRFEDSPACNPPPPCDLPLIGMLPFVCGNAPPDVVPTVRRADGATCIGLPEGVSGTPFELCAHAWGLIEPTSNITANGTDACPQLGLQQVGCWVLQAGGSGSASMASQGFVSMNSLHGHGACEWPSAQSANSCHVPPQMYITSAPDSAGADDICLWVDVDVVAYLDAEPGQGLIAVHDDWPDPDDFDGCDAWNPD